MCGTGHCLSGSAEIHKGLDNLSQHFSFVFTYG